MCVEHAVTNNGETAMVMGTETMIPQMLGDVMLSQMIQHSTQILIQMVLVTIRSPLRILMIAQSFGAIQLLTKTVVQILMVMDIPMITPTTPIARQGYERMNLVMHYQMTLNNGETETEMALVRIL
tara:strand:+ start:65 stop:442 length:378 start_codon:yes stop_codon:yes gene_type:complete